MASVVVAEPFSFSVFSVRGICPDSRHDDIAGVNFAVSELPLVLTWVPHPRGGIEGGAFDHVFGPAVRPSVSDFAFRPNFMPRNLKRYREVKSPTRKRDV